MITVVIPLFNKEHSIDATIRSVLNQTFKDFELVVVNDGSTDSSLKIVKDIHDDRLKVFSRHNSGVSDTRNYGINVSSFEYIAFLDADDYWETEFLQSIINLVQDYPGYYCYASNYMVKKTNLTSYPSFKGLNNPNDVYFFENFDEYLLHSPILTSSSVILKKNLFNIVGYFNSNISQGEDIDMWIRISKSLNMIFLNRPLVTYNVDSFGNTFKSPVLLCKNFIYYFSPYDLKSKIFFSYYSYNVAIKYLLYNNFNLNEFKFIFNKISKYSKHYFIVLLLSHIPQKILLNFYKKLYS